MGGFGKKETTRKDKISTYAKLGSLYIERGVTSRARILFFFVEITKCYFTFVVQPSHDVQGFNLQNNSIYRTVIIQSKRDQKLL